MELVVKPHYLGLIPLKRQIIGTAIAAADVDEFDAVVGAADDAPVLVEFLEGVGQVEEDVEMDVAGVVVGAVAAGYVPGAGVGGVGAGGGEGAVVVEEEVEIRDVVGFIITGIVEVGDAPVAGGHGLLHLGAVGG